MRIVLHASPWGIMVGLLYEIIGMLCRLSQNKGKIRHDIMWINIS